MELKFFELIYTSLRIHLHSSQDGCEKFQVLIESSRLRRYRYSKTGMRPRFCTKQVLFSYSYILLFFLSHYTYSSIYTWLAYLLPSLLSSFTTPESMWPARNTSDYKKPAMANIFFLCSYRRNGWKEAICRWWTYVV